MLRYFALSLALLLSARGVFAKPDNGRRPITFVVTDPLAKELACACVKGFGQRDYRKLATRIEKAVKQQISIEFSDDLAETLASNDGQVAARREVIVVGDRSLVADG